MKNLRLIVVLLLTFTVITSALLWNFSRLQTELVNSTALKTAELYSEALTQFRTLYTSEVIANIKNNELDITHDYASRDNAIPLPATLSMKLGEEIGKQAIGAEAQLYSPYPFPWRKLKVLSPEMTSFEEDAWHFLLENPTKAYSRFEEGASKTVLRYAIADIMKKQCVACHNAHPDTPKKDWKVGDVRGVLAISLPLDNIVSHTEYNLKTTSVAYFIIGSVLIFIIGMVIIRLRNRSQELEKNVVEGSNALHSEIKERRKATESLTELDRQYRLLLDSAGEGIYGVDVNGQTTFINPTACRLLGYQAEELIGKKIHPIIHYNQADLASYKYEDSHMYKAMHDLEIHRVEDEVLWHKNGSHFPVEYTCTPLQKVGHLIGSVVIFNDISERKRIERMKEEFISTVSHELRTPLTSIKGALGIVVSGKLGEMPEKAQAMLKIAYDNSDRLALLINDLLDINKLQSNAFSFEMKPININNLISKAVVANQGYADKYKVQLIWQPLNDREVTVLADENRINQVLANLLSNAIKFSPSGDQVTISITHNQKQVRIMVSDNGSGIPPEFHNKIFDKFTQADSSDTRTVGGTGLGLAISKEIIEGHGGHIGFESAPGQGTIFFFELPLAAADKRENKRD